MNERTTLVTGGTGGIGAAVAVRLGSGGDRLLIAGRDQARGARVLRDLAGANPRVDHAQLPADLSLMADTARLADEVASRTSRLDAVVLCAGVFAGAAEWTSEGLERTFALNYLSRFLLLSRLLPLVAAAPSARVVLVANAGKYGDSLDLDAVLEGRAHPRRHLAAASQFANDLLAVELAARLAGTSVEVTCVFPGVVRTDVFRNARGVPAPLRWVARGVARLVGSEVETAAETPARLAQDPTVGSNGGFYGPGLRPIEVPRRAADPGRRQELWEVSRVLLRPWLSASAEVAS